eukprot:m51a1_g7112 hypothetical protein (150) ;mRNA; r:85161-85813
MAEPPGQQQLFLGPARVASRKSPCARSRSAKVAARAALCALAQHNCFLSAHNDVFRRARGLAERHNAQVLLVVVSEAGEVSALSTPGGMSRVASHDVLLPLLANSGVLAHGNNAAVAPQQLQLQAPVQGQQGDPAPAQEEQQEGEGAQG